MRHIVIRNLGPLAEADVFLNKINKMESLKTNFWNFINYTAM